MLPNQLPTLSFPKGKLRPYTITRLLGRPGYAGYVEAKEWNVSLRKGLHEGLVSFETFQKIQRNLETGGRTNAPRYW